MKSIKYILASALLGMLWTACTTEPKEPSQADIDAQVSAKVKIETDKIKAECDNQIMQAALWKKDSILVAMGKMKPSAVTSSPPAPRVKVPPAPPSNPPATPPAAPPTIGDGKPKMGGSKDPGTVGSGKPRMGGTKSDTVVGQGKPKVGGR